MTSPLKLCFVSINPEVEVEKNFYSDAIGSSPDYLVCCDDAAEADFVVVTDFSEPDHFGQVLKLPEVSGYPEKSIIISETDHPTEILPGLYSSGINSCFLRPYVDGWHFPFLNVRFPNQQIQLSEKRPKKAPEFLGSFLGYPSHTLRLNLAKKFSHFTDMNIKVAKDYQHFEENEDLESEAAQKRYVEILRNSHFSLCPRGRGPSSMRLYDSMSFGIVPVIISDEWIKPSFVDWDSCSIQIKERHLGDLHKVLTDNREYSQEMGETAKAVYRKYFAADALVTTLRSALDQLKLSLKSPPEITPWFVKRARLNSYLTQKAAFVKAVVYNHLNKI